MVVVSHLFFFLWKKLGKGVTRYESHPPSLKTVYFPTAPFSFGDNDEILIDVGIVLQHNIDINIVQMKFVQ